MVRAWYTDDATDREQRQPHMQDPPRFVEIKDLERLGLMYFQIFSDDYDNCEELLKLKKERNYNYEDMITISPDKLPNYDQWIKTFFTEHMHCDEEIRLTTEGSGYFDIRDTDDKWIRLELGKGDLIILPAGIYHRFTLDEKMVRAWYTDDDTDREQRQPHMQEPPRFVEFKDLEKLGLMYFQIFSDDYENCEELLKLRKDRHYNYEDIITMLPDKLPNYDQWMKTFFTEHLHCDEEIRLTTEGSGYFDVRDHEDKWIRIEVVQGDLIILPAGIYHRFTLDEKKYIQLRRYFTGVPVWTPFNRPAEDHEARKAYLKKYGPV